MRPKNPLQIGLLVGALSLAACSSSGSHDAGTATGTGSSSSGGSSIGIGGDAGGCVVTPLPDGGACTEDSQCPSGDYCDTTLIPCPGDGGISTLAGFCLPKDWDSGSCCHTGTDCGEPGAFCVVEDTPNVTQYCTPGTPCAAGTCGGPAPSCPQGLTCPTGLQTVAAAHEPCSWACVYPGNSCTPSPASDGG